MSPDAESGGEAEYGDPESSAPEPEGSESSFATGADEEGSLLDRLLARVAAGEEVSATAHTLDAFASRLTTQVGRYLSKFPDPTLTVAP